MNIRQLITFISLILLFGSKKVVQANRLPTHYAPELEVTYDKSIEPYEVKKRSVASIVLDKASAQMSRWDNIERRLKFYDVETIDGQTYTDENLKRRTVEKAFLKYLDKSLMEKVKNAKKGSALSSVKSAKTALSPNSEKSIAPNFKLKFRAKVLRGRGQLVLKNPYIDANAVFSFSGRRELNLLKHIDIIDAQARVSYIGHEDRFYSEISKPIYGGLKTRISSSTQGKSQLFDTESDNRFELLFSKGF